MQFCEKNRKIQRKKINVDFFLSKLCFFGVSSTELRNLATLRVGSGRKIENMEYFHWEILWNILSLYQNFQGTFLIE